MSNLAGSRFWPALLSICGVGFWFCVGFPFAHHNESFAWAAAIEASSGVERFLPELQVSRTYRPLGQTVAVGSVLLTDGSLAAIQIFNFALAAAAFASLVVVSDRPLLTALLCVLVGGVAFAGYIYLFHLHGVFYSPVLLMIPSVLAIARWSAFDRLETHVALWGVATIAFLFHPYAFIVAAAMYVGAWITVLARRESRPGFPVQVAGAVLIIAAALATLMVRPVGHSIAFDENLAGFLATYRATEVHWAVGIIAALLAFATVIDTWSGTAQRLAVGALALTGTVFVAFELPLLLLWFGACAARAVSTREWMVASLIGAATLLPAISPTGSPTYGIFAILAAVAAMSVGPGRLAAIPTRVAPTLAVLGLVAAAGVAVGLRSGLHVPVISRFAQPLLAERERTHQLESIVRWWKSSEYSATRLKLVRDAEDPVDSAHGLGARQYRPPTFQGYLDAYTGMAPSNRPVSVLLLTFGGEEVPGAPLVYSHDGRFAGPARVYLAPAGDAPGHPAGAAAAGRS